MADWMTTLEAGELLGLNHRPTTISMLTRHHVEGHKEEGGHGRWFWDRQGVEQLFAQRQLKAERKAAGLKWCPRCKRWRETATWFHKRFHLCKTCRPLREAELRQWKHRKTFANTNPESYPSGDPEWFIGEPAKPGDADKYECMFGWFQHKPQPPEGRREVYCKKCEAPRCAHHRELTPNQVVKLGQVPTRYPEHWVHDYADA